LIDFALCGKGMASIFVDGAEGTTGLRIDDFLAARPDLEVIRIAPELRKDAVARAQCLNTADVAVLCLPDVASREAVALISNPHTRIIDASTAHRVDPAWAYGLPELGDGQREKIAASKRVCVGGCHATGFILAVRPLVRAGILPVDHPVIAQSLTGYSGGGKSLIAKFESTQDSHLAICPYALALNHKHLPEMRHYSGLSHAPLFLPAVGAFYQGMIVSIFLENRTLPGAAGRDRIEAALRAAYDYENAVQVLGIAESGLLEDGMLSPTACNGTNRVDLLVAGHDKQTAVLARLDNLGKGAAGAAMQCLNLMLGVEEFQGLHL